jgi:hypothetical protein
MIHLVAGEEKRKTDAPFLGQAELQRASAKARTITARAPAWSVLAFEDEVR